MANQLRPFTIEEHFFIKLTSFLKKIYKFFEIKNIFDYIILMLK